MHPRNFPKLYDEAEHVVSINRVYSFEALHEFEKLKSNKK